MHSGGIQEGRKVGGKWIIERQLGAGGMGAIHVVRHAEMPLRAALKNVLAEHVQREGARERFQREAQMMALVRSMHVVQIHDFGTDDETKDLFLVMELLEGDDLSKLLGRLGPLPPLLMARLLAQSAKGLAAAHAQGVVHRDIKPQNLFLARTSDGSRILKVLDFGIGRLLDAPDAQAQKKLTGTHGAIGSPPYMSPEQLRASSTVDHRTDLWSLGATGYELLTGKLPFSEASDFAELVRQIVFGQPEPLGPRAPWAPAELIAIVERCLQRDLAKRYPDVAAMAADLARLLPWGDQITEAMLVPLSEPERMSVGASVAAGPPAMGSASMGAPVVAGIGAVPATAAGATAIMQAAAVPAPMATGAPVVTGTAASPAPMATQAPVVVGATASPAPGAPPRRTSVLVGAVVGLGVVGAAMGILAILSSRNAPHAEASGETQPPPVTDAGVDGPPARPPEPKLAGPADAGAAPQPQAAPPKTTGPRQPPPSPPRQDDPFGTNRQGK